PGWNACRGRILSAREDGGKLARARSPGLSLSLCPALSRARSTREMMRFSHARAAASAAYGLPEVARALNRGRFLAAYHAWRSVGESQPAECAPCDAVNEEFPREKNLRFH